MRTLRALELLPVATLFLAFSAGCQPVDTAPMVQSGGAHPTGGGVSGDGGVVVGGGIDGGPSGNVLASVISPQAIVLDSTNVYWTTAKGLTNAGGVGDASAGTGSVETVAKAGGAVTDVINGLTSPSSLAIANETLFVADGTGASGMLKVYTLNTIDCTPVAEGQFAPFPMAINSNATTLFWVTGSGASLTAKTVPTGDPVANAVAQLGTSTDMYQPVAITVLGSSLFVLASDGSNAAVLSVPSGEKPTTLWQGSSVTASDLTSLGDTLYFALSNTSAYGGEVLDIAASGGGGVITLAYDQVLPAKLAVVDNTVYFTSNAASGAVLSVSTGGGAVTTLASGLDYPYPIAVDDAVYVGTASAIVAVAK